MNPINVDFFTGIHNDPRVDADVMIYGLGSYIAGTAPSMLEYLYFVLTNNSPHGITFNSFYLSVAGGVIWDLGLPEKGIEGYSLEPGQKLGIGFLRDLFTRRLRYEHGAELIFQGGCTLKDGHRSLSQEFHLSLEYPQNPLQDAELSSYRHFFDRRMALYWQELGRIADTYGNIYEYADLHTRLGMHKVEGKYGTSWVFLEWMPAATELWLTTDTIGFQRDERFVFRRIDDAGLWRLEIPYPDLPHGTYIELRVKGPGTGYKEERRVPAFALWVEQDQKIQEQWCARVYDPSSGYEFSHNNKIKKKSFVKIYEAHIGIAQSYEGRTEKSVGSFNMFTEKVLPIVKEAGYEAVQLMGVLEHPLYKSFGYQVSGYFATSSRFGTPDDFKRLVDVAHSMGIAVILDIPHSHAAPNTEQSIAKYDTSTYFFADKDNQWGTSSFNYANEMTRRFLLSNCRYWLEEYHVDGFRFDAVGNMVYLDHGFGDSFSSQERSFYTEDGEPRIDEAGVLYLSLANTLVHSMNDNNITIAEEFSGMPGMTSAPEEGGLGFDYRFAMGIPDFWAKFIEEGRTVGLMWHEMTNHRIYDRTVSYVASHDQSINGHDAMIWRLIGDDMYTYMSVFQDNWKTSRGIALYKMMRLITLSTADGGFLNFMGDEFGHPEWIDAEGYAHRQWHLATRDDTKYSKLSAFDRDCMKGVVAANGDDFTHMPRLRLIHETHRIIAFERGNLLFVFNFHQTETRQNLELWVTPGLYTEVLSSDSVKYAGSGNLEAGAEHFSKGGGLSESIQVYLPPVTALVMVRK